jgi:hypothetical protein
MEVAMVIRKSGRVPASIYGMAGVFWVASELSKKRWIALPTLRNLKGVDIIAQRESSKERVEIQVKTIQGQGFWPLGAKRIRDIEARDSLFYVFVRPIREDKSGALEGFVVPSSTVKSQASNNASGKFVCCWYPPKDLTKYNSAWNTLG